MDSSLFLLAISLLGNAAETDIWLNDTTQQPKDTVKKPPTLVFSINEMAEFQTWQLYKPDYAVLSQARLPLISLGVLCK